MKDTSRRVSLIGALAFVLLVGPFALSAAGAEEAPRADQSSAAVRSEEYGDFIKEEFGVVFKPTVSKDEFVAALAACLGMPAAEVQPATRTAAGFSSLDAVSIAIKAADLDELAYSYPAAKAKKALAGAKLALPGLDDKSASELAAAVDTGLLPPALYKAVSPTAPLGAALANSLVGGALESRGLYKRYLGYVHDADIFTKVVSAYQSSSIIKAPELRAIVDAALKQGLVTGYNLKDSRCEPRFIGALSLVYGHSDIRHAVQLIGLLRSEGLDAKVQFEPKTSAFIYLKEWGDPGAPNDSFEVVQIENGNYIEYAKEYDLAFEFSSAADKARFQSVVLAYAKKNSKDQKGLIAGSWWQPLYYSFTELKDYEVITNQLIAQGPYYAQSFSLNEESAKVIAGFKALAPGSEVKSYRFWVDEPFYRYLKGDSK